jgi:hypothetical protein
MHQGSRLERLADGFFGHFADGEAAQFVVDQRQQLFGRVLVAGANCF